MRDPKGKTVADLFPQIFADDDDEDYESTISEDERQKLTDLITSENARIEAEQQKADPE